MASTHSLSAVASPDSPTLLRLLMSGTIRTCFDPDDIPDLLVSAEEGLSWIVWRKHLYGRCVQYGSRQGLRARHFEDESADCEVCLARRCGKELSESREQFQRNGPVYLTLVKPERKARDAITKQISRRPGTGWYIPLQNAFALISDVPIRERGGTSRSVEVSADEREALYGRLLYLWRRDAGRMRRPGFENDVEPQVGREPIVSLGTTNARLESNLGKADVPYSVRNDTTDIYAPWVDAGVQAALRNSNWNPPDHDLDWVPPEEILERGDPSKEDTA